MLRSIAAGAVVLCLVTAGCGNTDRRVVRRTPTTTPTTAAPAPPVGPKQLRGMLLHPEDVNPIMGVTGMRARAPHDVMPDDSASMEPATCLAIDGVAQEKVYAGSGFSAVREQILSDGEGNAHFVDQAVVLFPTAKQATDFFDAAAEQWPACEDYRHIQSGSEWVAGETTNVDGMLKTITTQQNAGDSAWQACGRALTVANNVVVDVNTCSTDPKDSAVVIAGQIAAKVPVT